MRLIPVHTIPLAQADWRTIPRSGAAAKDPKAVFEPLDAFLRWRVGLMERSIDLLQLGDYTGDGVIDTKQAIQVCLRNARVSRDHSS